MYGNNIFGHYIAYFKLAQKIVRFITGKSCSVGRRSTADISVGNNAADTADVIYNRQAALIRTAHQFPYFQHVFIFGNSHNFSGHKFFY